MNFLNKILLAVFLSLFCFCSIAVVGQAYSADHLILQDLDTEHNLATICQDDGSLCSDVEVVSFDDLDSDQKDQVVEMIASSAMDGYSYSSTLDLDKFSNYLSHSDEISYSSESSNYLIGSLISALPDEVLTRAGWVTAFGSAAVYVPSALGSSVYEKNILLRSMSALSRLATAVGVSFFLVGAVIVVLKG